jgi:exodeoxyribonuclease VII large subunit
MIQRSVGGSATTSTKEEEKETQTLSQFLNKIGRTIEQQFKDGEWVACEIASVKHHFSGHVYIEIIDAQGEGKSKSQRGHSATLFKQSAQRLLPMFEQHTGMALNKGMKVLLQVKAQLKPDHGFSLNIQNIDPNYTIGAIEAKANNIRKRINESDVAQNNKRLFTPQHFNHVAVLSPADAAGLGDFRAEADLLAEHNLCQFTYFSAKFEGKGNEASITDALKEIYFQSAKKGFDCLVFIRGGGSKSSLEALNELNIVYYICKFPIPVITGIGHAPDHVIVDEYAHLSFDTPSKVIEYINGINTQNYLDAEDNLKHIFHAVEVALNQYDTHLSGYLEHIDSLMEMKINDYHHHLTDSVNQVEFQVQRAIEYYDSNIKQRYVAAEDAIFEQAQWHNFTLDKTRDHIEMSLENSVLVMEKNISETMVAISTLNPQHIINKGYTILSDEKGIIDTVAKLNQATSMTATLKDGKTTFQLSTTGA